MNTTSTIPVPDPGGGPNIHVVLTHLEPTACDEFIRSALFGISNATNITYLSRLMREYTKQSDTLSSLMWRPPSPYGQEAAVRTYDLAKDLKRSQRFVVQFCETIIEGFKIQGIEMPPQEKYFSDPNREAPEDSIRYDQ